MSMAKGMKAQGVDIDPAILARGLRDGLAGNSQLTDDQAQAALTELQAEVKAKQEAKSKIVGDANKKEGDAFLAANKAKEGVVYFAQRPSIQGPEGGYRTETNDV